VNGFANFGWEELGGVVGEATTLRTLLLRFWVAASLAFAAALRAFLFEALVTTGVNSSCGVELTSWSWSIMFGDAVVVRKEPSLSEA
jgi:hypothetical protein